ncbi:ACP S-malonyltransferase [Legionella fallonii]|uniref:Malonyl CoA-acyl carrier protein transacylase n=1 Tax=Legionella fallonii LLAP-10 TaxID=1212491 RepID=A0A098G2C1_9GAMM|nr:ACP S-malonyltransferase [Legionella fallonii]CEG56114.1 Polyketide biosynthesis malonyl CoA-acyl carrier protein transacylase PksC [Legionella fallonii LLAP-10]
MLLTPYLITIYLLHWIIDIAYHNEKPDMTTFMFPGQGAQKKGMGEHLFNEFSQKTQQANDILGYSIQELCLADPQEQLGNTQYTQPALYVIEALSFLNHINSTPPPTYCIGHSLGEYSALFAAGVFDFETGLRLIKKRGELMAQSTGGSMLAVVGLPLERLAELLKLHHLESIDYANLNSPKQTVLSGPSADIAKAKEILSTEAKMCVTLPVSGAFHSRYMQDAAHEFGQFIKQFEFKAPDITVIANATVQPYNAENIKENLIRQIDQSVRWSETINYLHQQGETEFIEIGPGNVLTRLLTYF